MLEIYIHRVKTTKYRIFKYFCILVAILLTYNNIYSQQKSQNDTVKIRKIILEHSDSLKVNEILYPNLKIAVGNVVLKHDSSYMFCDSALYNMSEQTFRAFGNIHVISPTENLQDTVHMWGDSLNYYGYKKLATILLEYTIIFICMILLSISFPFGTMYSFISNASSPL